MTFKTTATIFLKEVYHFLIHIISMAGYVTKNASLPRTIAIVSSLGFALYLGNYEPDNSDFALSYFLTQPVRIVYSTLFKRIS